MSTALPVPDTVPCPVIRIETVAVTLTDHGGSDGPSFTNRINHE
jgi:hypothetical protein